MSVWCVVFFVAYAPTRAMPTNLSQKVNRHFGQKGNVIRYKPIGARCTDLIRGKKSVHLAFSAVFYEHKLNKHPIELMFSETGLLHELCWCSGRAARQIIIVWGAFVICSFIHIYIYI